MEKYKVDVPVKVNIWIRPECQKRQFEIIRQSKPSILFLVSDGGRTEAEKKIIEENRKLIDDGIDWECTVYRLYESENLGMYTMAFKAYGYIWKLVDRCIFLEDDILPSVSFFRYCADLLEKYKDDYRINCVCGMNHMGVYHPANTDYFFSKRGSIWGVATWRRVYQQYFDFSYGEDPYVMNLLLHEVQSNNRVFTKQIKTYATSETCDNHVAGDEFFFEFGIFGQHQLRIIPKYNLVSNIGCTSDSAHSDSITDLPKGIRRIFNMQTYEINFPMKSPCFIIADVDYGKKVDRIMGFNHPFVSAYRKVERAMRKLAKGDIKYIVNKLAQRHKTET